MFSMSALAIMARFFAKCRDLLAPDGVMLLHTIGKLGKAAAPDPFTDKYIFPGYHLPSILADIGGHQLRLITADMKPCGCVRLHVAALAAADAQAKKQIVALYDERFFRMWNLPCRQGCRFRSGSMCNYQLQYVRDRRRCRSRAITVEAERKYRASEGSPGISFGVEFGEAQARIDVLQGFLDAAVKRRRCGCLPS